MAPWKTLEMSSLREGALSEIILPSPMVGLLVAFEPCFTAPSSRTFGRLVAGWMHCLGRRTITAVAVAWGGVERMPHDRLLSTARTPFCSFGHVWVVLALWVPLPMGGTRGFALPLLFRLYVGAKRGGTKDAPGRPRRGTRQQAAEHAHAAHPRPTKLALARELLALVAGWVDGRTVYAVVDSAYAARPLLEDRPANVEVLSRMRLDAALWARPDRKSVV